MSLEFEKGPSYVFLVLTKKARKGCQERSALYHESLDYPSMFLDHVYERLKDSRNLPFLCMLRILKKKPKRDVMRKRKVSPKSRMKTETTQEIKSYNIVTKSCNRTQLFHRKLGHHRPEVSRLF